MTECRFEEAHTIKMEVLAKEKGEQDMWLEEREKKIQKKLQVIITRQNNEIQALRKGLDAERTIIERDMNAEIEQ